MTAARNIPGAQLIGALYAAGTRARRARFSSSSGRVRRLAHPVISVGNLRVGGSGKTPLVAQIVEWLQASGERVSVLSRGYGRRESGDIVVVSDGERMCADVGRSGDEPFMLARRLPRAVVVVAPDRHSAGRIAEERHGATVHVLDDGFQHLLLARDLDIVSVTRDDVTADSVLPAGRLREPVSALVHADAVVVMDATSEQGSVAVSQHIKPGVLVAGGRRQLASPLWFEPRDTRNGPRPSPATSTALALSGIARPERFVDDLAQVGWTLSGTVTFADHHDYSASDIARIQEEASRTKATVVVTTEKDAVRLLRWRPLPFSVVWHPMRVQLEPEDAVRRLVLDTVAQTRSDVVARQPGSMHGG